MTARGTRGDVWLFVAAITVLGIAVLVYAGYALARVEVSLWLALLAVVTIASSRFRIQVPGHAASVSVSEFFVFALVLVFGPAPATLVVAFDGLLISLTQRDRRLYRALFNICEPAVSTAAAAYAFYGTLALPLGFSAGGSAALMLPTVAMAATYFAANSGLTASAVAIESGAPIGAIWKSHAAYLAINYYAAASLAVLVFKSGAGINVGLIGLVAPLLALSFSAYKAAASRVKDADRHLREVEGLYQATVETLAIAVDAKDQVTHGHIRRVQRHTVAVARALGITAPLELRALEAASLLHDVGKLAVPDYVLNKPGALSHAEFERMKQHAAKGAEILEAVEFPYAVVPVVRHHHEQWNGKGYPDGLAGEDIPFGARILAVVDCFDAVTSDRPYRRKMSDEEGIEILTSRRGTMYDPKIVDVFVELIPSLRAEDRRIDVAVAPQNQERHTPPPAAAPRQRPVAADAVLPPDEVIAARFAELLPGAEACIFMPSETGDLAVSFRTAGVPAAVSALRISVGEGLAGWVAVNRHSIVNSHADLDLGELAQAANLQSCTAIPLFALGNLVGILSVYLPRGRKFFEDEIHAAGGLAQEIGLFMARARYPRIGSALNDPLKQSDRRSPAA